MSPGSVLRRCVACGIRPIAWSRPRVDYCYHCLPGGPFQPPPCRSCGSPDYYSGGLCRACHHFGNLPGVRSCRDCLAWGTNRRFGWLCHGCRGWRVRFPAGTCIACGRSLAVNEMSACRLCWQQATVLYQASTRASIIAANRDGQQLFIANLARINPRRHEPLAAVPARQPAGDGRVVSRQSLHLAQQPIMFEAARDMKAGSRAGFREPADPALASYLMLAAADHASRFGWTVKTTGRCKHGIRIVLGLHDAAGLMVRASDVQALYQLDIPVRAVLDVCDEAGVLDDDRLPPVLAWFEDKIAGLPQPIVAELRVWLRVMRRGSATPPRRRPRSDITTRLNLYWALPAIHAWAEEGHQSLREISRDDIRNILPSSGNARATMGQGLRSIFTILKTEKIIFANPIARIPVGSTETTYPLPAKIAAVRKALESPNPAAALMAALLAFHGLQARELRNLKTTDIRDGRLYLGDRVIPLADPVRVRLTAYLDHRQRQWPRTANPHLLIHRNIAGTLKPYGSRWAQLLLGMSPRVIREDRILHEIHATGGDVRRVCEMFGYSVSGAMRYLNTLDPPGIEVSKAPKTGGT